MVLLLSGTAQAQAEYELFVSSLDYQPGTIVVFTVIGPIAMSFSIRVTDSQNDIIAGRDAQLNETGGYIFQWTPAQDGEYNVTVTYTTGIIITKSFLIQRKVGPQDIAELYRAIFGVEQRLTALLNNLDTKVLASLLIGGTALVLSAGVALWTKKNVSRAESEFEKLMKSQKESAQMRAFAEMKKRLDQKQA